MYGHITVSIHTPVKGATSNWIGVSIFISVSIHTPVKGATLKVANNWGLGKVSIHTPVKGATPAGVFQHAR